MDIMLKEKVRQGKDPVIVFSGIEGIVNMEMKSVFMSTKVFRIVDFKSDVGKMIANTFIAKV